MSLPLPLPLPLPSSCLCVASACTCGWQVPELRRISLLYCYPSYFSDELIDAIASIDKVCKYIDMPLQHISDPVLKAMNRPPMTHTKV